MNVGDFQKFFGLPATNQESAVFLSSHGIDERPAFDSETGNPAELIELPSGVALELLAGHLPAPFPPGIKKSP